MVKQHWLRFARIVTALLFLTGFIFIFSDVGGRVPSMIYEVFTAFQFLPSVLKFSVMPEVLTAGFVIIILLTLFSGRVYCSAFCPLGILQDVISFFRRIIPVKRKRRKYSKALDFLRYPILGLSVISLFFTGILAINWLDPYSNFGRISSNVYQPIFISSQNILSKLLSGIGIYAVQPIALKVFYPLPFFIALSVFVLILILVLYRDRIYCNTICPVGSILGLLSRISFLKINIDKTACTSCGKCQAECKANCIDMKMQKIDVSRCVSCFNCINVCEGESIFLVSSWKKNKDRIIVNDASKRNFLKASIVAMSTFPLLSQDSENNTSGEEYPCFYSRGPISPPGSVSADHLKDKCIACQLCISACPTKVLQPAFMEYGFTGMMLPRMANEVSFCNYECVKCSEVCPTHALIPLTYETKRTTQIGIVFFNSDLCIVKKKEKSCGSCSEHCPTQAVYMVPFKNGLTIPETNTEICIGCGACEYACPVSDPHVAIYVIPNKIHKTALQPVTEKVKIKETGEFPF